LHSTLNLGLGIPPRSGIEVRIKEALRQRTHLDTAIAWVHSHIGIPGSEEADGHAAFTSVLGEVQGMSEATTEGWRVRQIYRAVRASWRQSPGFGRRRADWHRHALSVYTWMRTNRGPQKGWLHHIGKAADTMCTCGHPSQDGNHIVFGCPRLSKERKDLLGARKSWEDLDAPN